MQPSSPADTLNSSGIMRLIVGGAESWMFGSVNVVNTDRISPSLCLRLCGCVCDSEMLKGGVDTHCV